MKKLKILVFLYLLSQNIYGSGQIPDVIIGIGEQECIPIGKLQLEKALVSVGNSQIVSTKKLGSCLMIKGKNIGFTDLVFFKGDERSQIQVFVVSKSLSAWTLDLEKLLNTKSQFVIKPFVSGLVVEGIVLSYEEAKTLSLSKELLGDKIKIHVKISEDLLLLSQNLMASRFPYFKTRIHQGSLVVEAFYAKENDKIFYEEEIKRIFPLSKIYWFENKKLSPQAKLTLKLIEIKEQEGSSKGFNWNKVLENFMSVHGGGVDLNANFEGALSFLANQGKLEIISQSSILIKEEEEARVFSGGEIPVVSGSKKQKKVEWKAYGLVMDVKLLGINQEVLKILISTEQSDLDTSQTYEGIPGLSKSNLKTIVQTKNKTPLVLTGLTKLVNGDAEEGVWGLSKIPFLGNLFKTSHHFQRKSFLMFSIQPEIDYSTTPNI